MSSIWKYPIAIVLAAITTFSLFFLMQLLIAMGVGDMEKKESRRIADIHMPEQELQVMKAEEFEKPPEPEPPPDTPPPTMQLAQVDGMQIGNLNISSKIDTGGVGFIKNSDMVPLAIIPPTYPPRAQTRGTEGWCEVEFTVLEDGTVDPKSIVVVDADPKNVFNRSSKRAAAKFKYQPRLVDGEAVPVDGVGYRFTYQLDK